jgi:hypothetical protein
MSEALTVQELQKILIEVYKLANEHYSEDNQKIIELLKPYIKELNK